VDQVAHCIIRLQRSAACEERWLGTSRPVALTQGLSYAGEEPPAVSPAARVDEFLRAAHCHTLLRYEAACNRQIRRNLDLLHRLKAATHRTAEDPCPYLTPTEPAAPEEQRSALPPIAGTNHEPIRRAGATPPAGLFAPELDHTPQPGESGLTALQPGPSGPGAKLASFRNNNGLHEGRTTVGAGSPRPLAAEGQLNLRSHEESIATAPFSLARNGR
jgi:hypothetical protein